MPTEANGADQPLVALRAVTKTFPGARRGDAPVVALDGIDLDLHAGKIVGLVGPDAAGKTTLMRMIAGLARPDSGSLKIFGADIAKVDRGAIGYMPQHGALFADLSVAKNLAIYGDLRGLDPGAAKARFEQLYQATGLGAFRDRPAGRLSGGMRQKLALACAVVAAPRLMLLDEPSVGVDPVSRQEIWALMQTLAGDDTTIMWATSILEDAERCDEAILLHQGRVWFRGPPDALACEVKGKVVEISLPPAHRRRALRQALSAPQVIDGHVTASKLRLILRGDDAPSSPASLNLPEHAGIAAAKACFADGFIAMLDSGTPQPPSALAAATAQLAPIDARGSDQAIVADQLTRRFGDFTAADRISFTVRRGEIFGLLGPNGAGKSTTFRMLCGLLRPTSGEALVAGHDLRRASANVRQSLGYMPQKFSLYADLSLAANLRFVAGSYGLAGSRAREAIERVVDSFNLAPYWKRPTGSLPLGLRQRLALGAALMHQPDVLFLDEPTSGVDPLVRHEFWMHINALAARGVTIFITTHFMDEAEYCDRLVLIHHAKRIAEGTPDELKAMAELGDNGDPTLEQAFAALIGKAERSAEALAA